MESRFHSVMARSTRKAVPPTASSHRLLSFRCVNRYCNVWGI